MVLTVLLGSESEPGLCYYFVLYIIQHKNNKNFLNVNTFYLFTYSFMHINPNLSEIITIFVS